MLTRKEEGMQEKLICALLFGEAETEKEVEQIARSYQDCPYVSFMATKGRKLFATFFLPRRQRWWITYVEQKPGETFGLKKAKVTIVDHVQYPRQLRMRLPRKPQKSSPCGANCGTCPAYEKCVCCPATTFYKHTPQNRVS